MDKDTTPCENGVLTKSGYHIGYGHLVIGTACNMLKKTPFENSGLASMYSGIPFCNLVSIKLLRKYEKINWAIVLVLNEPWW